MKLFNPYQYVNWGWNQYKANFHTHTSRATIDGTLYGCHGSVDHENTIDAYHNANYDILALTQHDPYSSNNFSRVTSYPWEIFGKTPETLNMLAIQGKELSDGNHRGSLFNDLGEWDGNTFDDLVNSFFEIEKRSGLSILYHPGRYNQQDDYYFSLFQKFRNSLRGIEVYNQGDAYDKDRILWDRLLLQNTFRAGFLSRCYFWGYSNDDMHTTEHMYRNYNLMLMPELTEEALKTCMLTGRFYFCYEPEGSGEAKAPKITSITVDEEEKKIRITGDHTAIEWYVNGSVHSQTGNNLTYNNDMRVIRAVLTNSFGRTYTQPITQSEEVAYNF